MALLLLAAFILVPLIEIGLFIEIGGWLGLWPTLGLIVLTAIVGTALLRHQGLATLRRAQSQLDAGHLPAKELFDGVCLLVAGLLLLTPGFFTDAVGFALLLPPLRAALRVYLAKHVTTIQMRQTQTSSYSDRGTSQPPGGEPPPRPGRGWGNGAGQRKGPGPTIEGDYIDLTDKPDSPGGPNRDQ